MTGRKLITTPQIDEQLLVSTPKRAVIVHCSLIEEADEDPEECGGGYGPAFTQQTHATDRKHILMIP